MSEWQEALRRYRRRSIHPSSADAAGMMFILCSEDAAAAGLVAACEPALVLQAFGGVRDPSCPSTRATIEYAIRIAGVRKLILCAHQGCRASPCPESMEQCRALQKDPIIGALLKEHGVKLRALWFDPQDGDVYECSDERRRTWLADDDLVRMLDAP